MGLDGADDGDGDKDCGGDDCVGVDGDVFSSSSCGGEGNDRVAFEFGLGCDRSGSEWVPLGSRLGYLSSAPPSTLLASVVDETTLCSRDDNVLVEAEGETNMASDVVSVGEGGLEGGADFFLPASTLRMMRGSNPSDDGFPEKVEGLSVDTGIAGLSCFVMTPTPTSLTNVSTLPFITIVFVLGLSVSSDSLPALSTFIPSIPSAFLTPIPISTPPRTSLPSHALSPDIFLDG